MKVKVEGGDDGFKRSLMKIWQGRFGASKLIACASLTLLFGCSAQNRAQQSDHQVSQLEPAQPMPKPDYATIEGLQQFEGEANPRYTLGPGDKVTVTVWAHPEISGPRVVGPDGNIQLPFVGSIKFADLTTDEAGDKVTSILSDYYIKPVATVTVDSYSGNNVTVLGHVDKPGVLHFDAPPTLLEALAGAGSENGKAGPATTTIASSTPTRCAVFRGRNRVVWINLKPLLNGDDPALNIRLQRNDLVYVPDSDEMVYVMGQVKTPGAYPIGANTSVLSALAQAGGVDDNGQPSQIVLARPSQHVQRIINFKDFVQANNSSDYALEAGDIIYVPKSGIAKVGYVLQQLNPISTTLLFGAAIF
jgi:polysaccharide export outer membrane protein